MNPSTVTKYLQDRCYIDKIMIDEKKKLINGIKSRVNRGWPTGA